jgi:hypothetical protein
MHNRDRTWVAAAAWSVGLFAVLCDHFQPSPQVSMGVHALFGIVTCGAISIVLIDTARTLTGVPHPALYQFTRLVSRWVYILLYALALARVAVYLYEASGYCLLCRAQEAIGPARPLDDFQFYVGCCVLSLWSVRALVLAVPFKGRDVQAPTTSHPANIAHSSTLALAGSDTRHARV